MFNLAVTDGKIINGTHIAKTITREKIELLKVPENETRCTLLGNLFLCEGKPGKVLKVSAKIRTGEENFISAMRKVLAEYFTDDKTVGLGGVFLLKAGKAKQHVMDDFSKEPLNSEEELNNWLTFHSMSAELIAVGTFVTNECDLDLRLQHFHSFSKHGEGGHYHYDTTPETVEYEGYFNVGTRIVRIDKPIVKLNSGSLGALLIVFYFFRSLIPSEEIKTIVQATREIRKLKSRKMTSHNFHLSLIFLICLHLMSKWAK